MNPQENARHLLKVIIADKSAERGVQLLKEQPGWNMVLTTKRQFEP